VNEKDVELETTLAPATYIVKHDTKLGFYLELTDSFKPLSKYYGDVLRYTDRILRTFDSRPNCTGVLLTGEKGSGKTLQAKVLSIEGIARGIPTLLVNAPFGGDDFNSFIQRIDQKAILIFDEFEKVYDPDDDGNSAQSKILTLLDGVFPSQKLFVLTCNNKYKINSNMTNRPGRIFYKIEYEGASPDFIREYCQDNLDDKSHIESIVLSTKMFFNFNFDMLKAVVEEMNRYKESPKEAMQILNVKPDSSHHIAYNAFLTKDGKRYYVHDKIWRGDPLSTNIRVRFSDPDNLNDDKPTRRKVALTDLVLGVSTDMDEFDSEEGGTIIFTPKNITSVDQSIGLFTYEKKGFSLILRKEEEYKYEY
jgi:hypothetical protein